MSPQIIHSLGWLIPGLPVAAFLVIAAFCLRPPRDKIAPYLLILGRGGSLLLSFAAGLHVAEERSRLELSREWLAVGDLTLEFGLLFDSLSANMLIVVCAVSLLVQIYSMGYMKGDPGYGRYFAYMALFSMAMLGLVVASSLLQLYVFW